MVSRYEQHGALAMMMIHGDDEWLPRDLAIDPTREEVYSGIWETAHRRRRASTWSIGGVHVVGDGE